jgi:hypothetical protein
MVGLTDDVWSLFTEVNIEYTETSFNTMKEKNVYWLITAKKEGI